MNESPSTLADTEHLRQILVLMIGSLAWAGVVATFPLACGWIYDGLMSAAAVPPLLPVLTLAALGYTAAMWIGYSDIRRIGLPS